MDSLIWMPLLSAAVPSLDRASTAIPTPLPTTLAVPTAASAAKPTAVAVTLTAVAVTATTVQPASNCGSSKAPARAQARQRMGRVAFRAPACLASHQAKG